MPQKESTGINYGNKLEEQTFFFRDLHKIIDNGLCLNRFEKKDGSCMKSY